MKTQDGFKLQWVMSRIDLKQKVKGTDGHVYVDIIITDELGEKTIRVSKSVLSSNRITSLDKYNIAVFPENATPMAIYFERLLAEMPMVDAAQVYGIIEDPITHNLDFNSYENNTFKTKTEYNDFDDYLLECNRLLKKSEPLQYLLSATMAAPVLTLLKQRFNYDLHSYCINMVGSSSTGKTIASRFCAAAWTNPNDDNIFSAMLSTGNAALKRLSGRYGIPTFLDEASVLGGIKADEYAYSVYEGREKRRLNSDCSEKASGTWSTIVCMSSEEHFHSNTKNQNGGLAVRVHSMENLSWTASKKHAEQINSFITTNYGVLGKHFTDILFKREILDELPERYADAKEAMTECCKNEYNSFTDRLCNIYALTYMTAVILEGMGVAVDVEAVAGVMAGHNAMVSSEQNLALNAFRAIVSYVARNSYKSGVRQYKDADDRITKIAIEESLLRDVLAKAGFKDMKVTVKELDKAGYIIRQVTAGLKSKLTIDYTLCWCYQINMRSLSDEVFAEPTNNKSSNNNVVYLTADDIADQINDTGEEYFSDDEIAEENTQYSNEEYESSDCEGNITESYDDDTEGSYSYQSDDEEYTDDEYDSDEEIVESNDVDWSLLTIEEVTGNY